MPTSPKPEQVEEWLEGEVTRYLRRLIQSKLDFTFRQRGEIFFPYEPNKTQEGKAMLLGAESALQDLLDAMDEKDLSQLETDDEERVRNSPLWGSSPDQT
jgi:hypothetical protein